MANPPDSGEREVCGAVIARVNGDPLRCDMPRSHNGPHTAMVAQATAVIPLPLAQRILAALELTAERTADYGAGNFSRNLTDLAAELRAAVERKP